jgi:hypothetical protein
MKRHFKKVEIRFFATIISPEVNGVMFEACAVVNSDEFNASSHSSAVYVTASLSNIGIH